MPTLRFTSLLVAALASGLVLSAGCNNRTRSRVGDTGVRPDTGTTDSGTTDSGTPVDSSVPDTSTRPDTSVPDTSTTGDGDAAVAAFRMVIEADCNAAHRCRSVLMDYFPDATDADFVDAFGNDPVSCVSLNWPSDAQARVRTAVNGGTMRYDGGSVSPCVSSINTSSCMEYWMPSAPIASCEAVFTGTLSNGAACAINGECISGTCDGGTMTCVAGT